MGVPADSVNRLMRMLAARYIFDEQGEHYSINSTSDFLRTDHPMSQHSAVMMLGGEPFAAFAELESGLTGEKIPFEEAHGMLFFEFAKKNPRYNVYFNDAMASMSIPINEAIASDVNFDGISVLADIGGGTGSLLRAILGRRPDLKGILFDQPHVLDGSFAEAWRSDPLSNRISLVSGSFLEDDIPPGADGYLLKWIVHDWDDADVGKIYQRIRAAMTPNSRLYIAESVITDARDPFAPLKTFLDLHMLSLFGSRERTLDEHRSLLEAADLQLASVVRVRSPVSVLVAVPAPDNSLGLQ